MTKQQQLPLYSICSLTGTAAIENDLMIDRLDHYLDTHQNLYFPHKHPFYQIVLFTGGAGEHSIDFIHFPVEKAQIYFMVPGQVHTWNFQGNIEGYIIHFSENYFHSFIKDAKYLEKFSFFSGYAIEQVINLPEGGIDIIKIFEEMITGANSVNEYREDILKVELVRLLLKVTGIIQRPVSKKRQKYNSLVLYNFKRLIERNYRNHKLTRDYSAELSVTPNHLNALCRKETARSAGGLIRERVVLEAKRLLIDHKKTILEISNELNFIDNSYFTKFFKKSTGVTPEKFKDIIRLENVENASVTS